MASKKAAPEGPVEVPEIISILPLRNSVLFPGAIIPIDVGRRKSVRLVEDAIAKERPVIGILTQKDARTEDPGAGDLYMVGCAARILKVIKLAKDNFSRHPAGRLAHSRCSTFDGQEPFLVARRSQRSRSDVERRRARRARDEPQGHRQAGHQADARAAQGGGRARRQRHRAGPPRRSDHVAPRRSQVDEKQDVLETFDLKTRMRKVLQFLSRQLEVLKVRERINTPGAGGDGPQPARVRAAPAAQGDQGRARRARRRRRRSRRVRREDHEGEDARRRPRRSRKKQLKRLKVMQPSSAEYTVTRTYLEWLVELPWSISTEDNIEHPGRAQRASTRTTTASRR